MTTTTISGFTVHLDRAYDLKTHMWVEVCSPDRIRIGMDSLGLETSGTLAQLQFDDVDTTLFRGTAIGSLEAEKFVGPLMTPISGQITAINLAAMRSPSLVEQDPYGAGWMIELAPSELEEDMALLTQGAENVTVEFEAKIAQYKRDGVLAE